MFRKGMGDFVQCMAMAFWQSEQWVQQNISPLGETALGMGEESFEIMQGKGLCKQRMPSCESDCVYV